MLHFTQAEVDGWILEDLPVHDETSRALQLPRGTGVLSYVPREAGVLAGVAPCAALGRALGLEVQPLLDDGAAMPAGQPVLRLRGPATALHVAWKQGMNLLEHLSGIASATARMLNAARAGRAAIQLAATRKSLPGARRLQQYAVLCGGGVLHRAGLSETILVFAQHRIFLPGLDVAALVARARQASPEKFVLVEADDAADALAAVRAGADGVQLDKATPQQLSSWVPMLRAERERVLVVAAGGVRADNAAAYAATGVDVLATSSLYSAPPLDFAARMEAAG